MARFKQALLLYHVEAREKRINEMMAKCLRDSGIVDDIIIEKQYDAIFHIYDYHPDLIISQLPRDDYSSSLFTMVKMVTNCVWIAIPTEGFYTLDKETIDIVIGYNSVPRKLVDYYLFWGPETRKHITKELFAQSKITSKKRTGVFGYLPYEKEMIKNYWEEDEFFICLKEKASKASRTILAVTGVMGNPYTMELAASQGLLSEDEEKMRKVRIMIERINYFSKGYVDLLYCAAKKYTDCLFIIKMHPVEINYIDEADYPEYANLRSCPNVVFVEKAIQISQLFSISSLLVQYCSTTGLERYIYDIPSIGVENDYYEVNGLNDEFENKELVFATRKCKVSEKEKFLELIGQNICIRKERETEKILYELMNYSCEKDYKPSDKLVNLFKRVGFAQKLSVKDPIVIEKLRYRSCWGRRGIFVLDAIKALASGDFGKAGRIMRWLFLFYCSCIKSVFYVEGSKR